MCHFIESIVFFCFKIIFVTFPGIEHATNGVLFYSHVIITNLVAVDKFYWNLFGLKFGNSAKNV